MRHPRLDPPQQVALRHTATKARQLNWGLTTPSSTAASASSPWIEAATARADSPTSA